MLVPRKLSRTKLAVLLSLLAVAVGVGVYLVAANIGLSFSSLPKLTTAARFGGGLDARLELPDPSLLAEPGLFDRVVSPVLQDDGTLPLKPGTTHNIDPFAPLQGGLVKKH